MNNLISEGLLIALFPSLSYALVFSFECGYVYYWKIPTELIKINLSTIFLGLLGVLTSLFAHLWLFSTLNSIFSPWRFSWILILAIPILMSFLSVSLFRIQFKEWIWFSISLLFFLILFIVVLILIGNNGMSGIDFEDRLIYPFSMIFLSPIVFWFYILFIAFFSVLTCFMIGRIRAIQRPEYLVYEDKPDEVVLRHYGDILICGKINKQYQLTGEFVTYNIADRSCINFSWKKIGPLKILK